MTGSRIVGWIAGCLLIILIVVWLAPFTSVSAGHRAVITRGGKVVRVIDEGYHRLTPAIESATEVDVRTQIETAQANAASKDLQTVSTKVAVNYNVIQDKVEFMWNTVGKDYKAVLIDPAIQEAVKSATAKHTAEELITQRQTVKDEITSTLHDRLASTGFLNVTQVSLTDFDFSPSFNNAIETKATAVQNAEAAKNNLVKVQYEQQAVIEQAKAQAETIRIQATAINSQGGADYVALQAIKTWDGHGCTSYCFGNGSQTPIPVFNLNNLNK